MRRNLLIVSLLSLLLGACSYTDEQMDVATNGVALPSLRAKIDTSYSRTYAVDCEDGSVQMLWHQDDQIMVTDGTSNRARYKLDAGADTVEATFVVDDTYSSNADFAANAELYAISPANRLQYNTTKGVRAHIPSLQYVEFDGVNDTYRNVMIARGNIASGEFDFKLVTTLVRFDLKLQGSEKIVSVKMEAEDVNIAGYSVVDWDAMSLQEGTSKYVELDYGNVDVLSPSSEGWAQILPIDWTKGEGNVYYTVKTDSNIYKFCKRPTKDFAAGGIYTFPLYIDEFELVESEGELSDGKYCVTTNGDVMVAHIKSTDSTITIGWTVSVKNADYIDTLNPHNVIKNTDYTSDIEKNYKVAIYSDAECQNLVLSVDNISKESDTSTKKTMINNHVPPRFTFPGLAPSTTYYVKVWNNTDDTVSDVLEVNTQSSVVENVNVVTQNAQAGDLILFENFADLIYSGELSSRGMGISRTDRSNLTEVAPATGSIVSGKDNYYVVSSGTEMGLFNTLKGLIDDFGLTDWGYVGSAAGSICARPGYVKIGTKNNRAYLCTPELSAIPAGKAARLKIQFKAAPYGEYDANTVASNDRKMYVRALLNTTVGDGYKITYNQEVCDPYYVSLQSYVTSWKNCTVYLENVPSTARIAFGGGTDVETATSRLLLDDIRIYVEEITDYVEPWKPDEPIGGTVTYSDGTPAAGISVSDGYTVVQTDAEGKYTLVPHIDTWYIYYSIPEDCQVPMENGHPCFYKKFDRRANISYDFTLTKLAGGKESNFTLFCLADPQCRISTQENQSVRDGYRFQNESVPAIKGHVDTKSVPCYGVTLGDIVYSEGSRNCVSFMPTMRGYMAQDKIGMPIFQTMGNHDYADMPWNADDTSSTFDIKAQRAFEDCFGPINYTWNRGDAHIISMRNMHWSSNNTWNDYTMGFTSEQVEWLSQDLATVPKDKLVIFCVHVPFVGNSSKTNAQTVVSMLQEFENCHIMSGHTHYNRNDPTTYTSNIYEHVHAALCGQWWWSDINGDGVPNGYGVYDIEGNTIKNWYYMGVNDGMNYRDYQIRLYRGDLKSGTEDCTFEQKHGHDVILANVFNADNVNWEIEIFADGVSEGLMEFIPEKKYTSSHLNVYYSPIAVPSDSCQDWWAIGYHIGYVGRNKTNNSYYVNCFHMYKHTLQNKDAKDIRVEATDPFGRKYTCSEITGDYDYSMLVTRVW